MQHLSGETVRLLSSAQVITSVLSAVKELLENALDAGADSVEVKLENFGLDKIEVRDNGSGIASEDVALMGQRHYTSKLSDFHDLATVTSYGFRGEALASLCAVADVCVTTKQASDDVSRIHVLNHGGEVVMTKPSHLGNGTTVTATSMFKTLPVRRQYYNNSFNRKKEELRKVTDLVMCYGYVNPGSRLTLSHNRKVVWQKSKVATQREALLNIMGSNVMSQLLEVKRCDDETEVSLSGFIPRRVGDPQLVGRAHNDRCWMYINKRPVNFKEAEKLIKKSFSHCLTEGAPVKNIVVCLHFVLPTEAVDVNLEPGKKKVLLQNKNAVLSLLTEVVNEVYAKPRTPKKSRQSPQKASVASQRDPGTKSRNEAEDIAPSHQKTDACLSGKDDLSQTKDLDGAVESQTAGENQEKSVNITALEPRTNQGESVSKRAGIQTSAPSSGDVNEPSFSFFDDELLQDTQETNRQHQSEQSPAEFTGNRDGDKSSGKETLAGGGQEGEPSFSLFDDELFRNTQEKGQQQPEVRRDGTGVADSKDGNVSTENKTLAAGGQGGEPSFSLFDEGIFVGTPATNPQQTVTEKAPDGHGDGDTPRRDLTSIIMSASESATMDIRQFEGGVQNESTRKFLVVPDSSKGSDRDIAATAGNISGVAGNLSKNQTGTELKNAGGSLSDWSKGVLLGSDSAPVEPVKLLVPGSRGDHCDGSTKTPYIQRPPSDQEKGQNIQRDVLSRLPSMESTDECPRRQSPGTMNAVGVNGQTSSSERSSDCQQSSDNSNVGSNQFMDTERLPVEERRETASDEAQQNGTNTPVKGYSLPSVSDCIPLQKPSVAQRCIPAAQPRSGNTDPSVSNKKKPALPTNPTKRKRTSKKTHLISNQGLINEMLASQEKRRPVPAVTTRNIPFSVDSLGGIVANNALPQGVEGDQPRLICKLRQLWVVLESSKILLFNHFRAEEVVLYHKLLATHVLPTVDLDVPITLNASMFESRGSWLTLLSLKTSHARDGPISEYTDQRLTANGFKIQRLIDKENRDIVLRITAVADLMPCYGTADLQEILDHISASPGVKLKDCRPLKVSNYLKGEAVRIVRNRPPSLSVEEARELMTSVQNISSTPSTCLHGKPLFVELCSLDKPPPKQCPE